MLARRCGAHDTPFEAWMRRRETRQSQDLHELLDAFIEPSAAGRKKLLLRPRRIA